MANEIVNDADQLFIADGAGDDVGFCAVGNDPFNLGLGETNGAMRFLSVSIPQGITLNMARLVYIYGSVGDGSGSWKFKVRGIDEDNTSSFSDNNPLGRPQTSAEININEGKPTSGGTKTFDVKSIVEEIVGRGGWSSGNALGITFANQGSDNDIGAQGLITSYLVWRRNAEPDFTPTPIALPSPAIPDPKSNGIKIARPGFNVLDANEAQLYFTSRKRQFKVISEGQAVTSGVPHRIAHGLGKIPFTQVFAKSGNEWFRLPFMNFSGGSNIGYTLTDDTNLDIYVNNGTTIYYYIFLDELAT